MKPCKHLDYTPGKFDDCEIHDLAPYYPNVRYWLRGQRWTDAGEGCPPNPASVQFCGASRGRINGIFQCYNGEMSCYEPAEGATTPFCVGGRPNQRRVSQSDVAAGGEGAGMSRRRPLVVVSRLPTPQEALDAYHAKRNVSDVVVEAERRNERLRAEGWSRVAIAKRLDNDHPLGGAIDSYYGGSLTPSRVPYIGESSVSQRRSEPRVRFPSWRNGYSE